MTSLLKTLSCGMLVVLGVQGLVTSSVWGSWALLELGSVIFISILSADFVSKRQSEVLKFYLVQAFSGMLILLLLLLNSVYSIGELIGGVVLLLCLKMGAVPFHVWLVSLSYALSWETLYLFLTVQKIIPLYLLSSTGSNLLWVLSLSAWAVAGLGGLRVKGLKKLFIYSSLAFMGILLYLTGEQSSWIKYLLLYSMIGLPVFILTKESVSVRGTGLVVGVSSSVKPAAWLTFLNLGGLPPLPGFFIKLSFLSSSLSALSSMLVFLFSSVLIMYMYMGLSFSMLLGGEKSESWSGDSAHLWVYLALQLVLCVVVLILCVGVIT